MRAALHRGDVVSVAVDVLSVAVGVLQGRLHVGAVLVSFYVDGRLVKGVLRPIDPAYELHQPALEAELLWILLSKVYPDTRPLVQEGVLPDAGEEDILVEFRVCEDDWVGLEGDSRPEAVVLPDSLQATHWYAPLELHEVLLPVAPNSDLQPLREGVHHREADAVEAPRDLVHLPVELAARVEGREDYLDAWLLEPWVDIHGDAPAVVLHGDDALRRHHYFDVFTVASHGLIDAVVQDLVDQVVHAALVHAANVHGGPLPDSLEVF